MKLINTKIKDGPKIIKTIIYKDKRGFLKETFNNRLFKNKTFPFDIMSYSKKCFKRVTFTIKKTTKQDYHSYPWKNF